MGRNAEMQGSWGRNKSGQGSDVAAWAGMQLPRQGCISWHKDAEHPGAWAGMQGSRNAGMRADRAGMRLAGAGMLQILSLCSPSHSCTAPTKEQMREMQMGRAGRSQYKFLAAPGFQLI